MKNLVIVESPAKGKTIEKYLGPDYQVKASVGHIRDLAKKDMGIDLETFEPNYEISSDKKKVVSELKKIAKASDHVWIATDEDREGEAIGWHLCAALGLDPKTTKRVTYGEITKKAVTEAFQNPKTIDQDLVDAQQARRLLDRIVGFEVSPVLWRKIPGQGGLSAGRVQSVAVRLVVDKEKEIEAFVPKESWKLKANCSAGSDKIQIEYAKKGGKGSTLKSEQDVADTLKDLGIDAASAKKSEDPKKGTILLDLEASEDFTLSEITTKETKRSPAPPFTTSTLQQEASRKHGFSVKQTMTIAQGLYQNGLITYMRTDSVNLSKEAMAMSLGFIEENFGKNYAFEGGRKYKTKSSGAQEAHEAIRPSYIDKTPETVNLSGNDLKLYTLIWKRTVASQMKEAQLETTTYNFVPSSASDQIWQAKGQVITFDGFMKLYIEGKDDENEGDDSEVTLPKFDKGAVVQSQNFAASQHFSRPPARYTEATLVKKLESEGIGRPSTYAPTISTIIDRGYIEKEKKHLHPTALAKIVTEYLEKNFEQMMDYKFTANVEEDFDQIAEGKIQWKKMLESFYKDFHPKVEEAGGSERMTGERELGTDPESGKPVIARMGRFGPMVQIGSKDDEEKPRFAGIPKGMDMDKITFEDAMELFKLPRELGEMDGEMVKSNVGRFGPYVQLGKTFASIPKDPETGEQMYDVMSITFEEAKQLIVAKKEADANKYIAEFDSGIEILRGRYGPYIKFEKGNYKIPKELIDAPEKITEAQAKEIVETTEPSGRGRKKKAAPKKK